MVTISENLAAFALSDFAMPDDVLSLARMHFLDTTGVAVASSGFEFAQSVNDAASKLGDGTQARSIGSGQALPAASAALVNGCLAHGLDFDDTHIAAIYHASAAAFASALAVGEAIGATGRETLEAYVVALEVGCRLALVAHGEFHDRGLHPTALCGPFATAAAAGRLYGLSQTQLADALGLCGSQAGGVTELEGSWLKRLHPGWAAHAGLTAAFLGRAGFKGPRTIFEGPRGFYAAHLGRIPQADEIVTGLGQDWALMGLGIKPYPCCHFIHAFADAGLDIFDENGGPLRAEDIAHIEAPLSQRLHHMVAEPADQKKAPQTEYDALFSVPFAIGLALARGKVDLSGFYDGGMQDRQVLDIAAKVTCTVDVASDFPAHFPGELRIAMVDGTKHVLRKPQSRGTPGLRLSDQGIIAKFRANAGRVLPEAQLTQLEQAVMQIDTLPDLNLLIQPCIWQSQETSQ